MEAAQSDGDLGFVKEINKQDMKNESLHNKNSNWDDSLEGASLLTNLPEPTVNAFSESEPKEIESYVEVTNMRKKRSLDMENNQNGEDQNNGTDSNEVDTKQFEQGHDGVSVYQLGNLDLPTLKAIMNAAKAENGVAETDSNLGDMTVETCRTTKMINSYKRRRKKSSDDITRTLFPAADDDARETKSVSADEEQCRKLDNNLESPVKTDHASRDEAVEDTLLAETSVCSSNCRPINEETVEDIETKTSKGASNSIGQSLVLDEDKRIVTSEDQSPINGKTTSDYEENVHNSTYCCNSSCDPRQENLEVETKVKEITSSNSDLVKEDCNSNVKKLENDLQPLHSSLGGPDDRRPKKKLLILDVNGVLVDIQSYVPNGFSADLFISRKAVFKQPVCDDFIQFCFEKFDVGIWSSRAKKNVDVVVNFLFGKYRDKLLFCWDQSHCTTTGFGTLENRNKPLVLKELRKLWDKVDPNLPWEKGQYDASNTLLLDDSPYKALRNPPYTAIFPYPYKCRDLKDTSLAPGGDLRGYLEGVAAAENVQKFVEENPFGQLPITESNTSWNFYQMVIDGNGNADQPE